jgi:hypothetical protein
MGTTYQFSKRKSFLLLRDNGALDKELVLALGVDRRFILHRLEHDWTQTNPNPGTDPSKTNIKEGNENLEIESA